MNVKSIFCLDYGGGAGTSSEAERLSASIGTSVDLPCRLSQGYQVSWRRDGAPLPLSAQQIRNVLRIDRVTEQDSGRYICSSEAGTQYVDLRVERKYICLE